MMGNSRRSFEDTVSSIEERQLLEESEQSDYSSKHNVPCTYSVVVDTKKRTMNFRFNDIAIGDQIIQREIFQKYVTDSGAVEERKIRSIRYEYPIELFGDCFYFSKDEEGCYLSHKEWTLIGEGKDFEEAKEDLRNSIRELKDHYARLSINSLDPRAIQFREYLISTLNA
jgi:hypothetical protein